MSLKKFAALSGLGLSYLFLMSIVVFAQTPPLLNVSYDVSRELYKDINPAFIAAWKAKTGETLTVNQSHGGWAKANADHFADGATYDQIIARK